MKNKKLLLKIILLPFFLFLVFLTVIYFQKYTIHKNIDLLKSKDKKVRKLAAGKLGKIGKPAVEPLVFAIRFDTGGAKSKVVEFVGSLTGQNKLKKKAEILEEENLVQKAEISKILGEIGDIRAVEPLANLLRINDDNINRNVENALVKFGNPSVDPLIKLLNNKNLKTSCTAARILGKIGDKKALEPLVEKLKTGDVELKDAALDGLVGIGKPSVKPLIGLLGHNDPKVRHRVVNGLGRIGAPSTICDIMDLQNDENKYVRYEVKNALKNLKKKIYTSKLMKKLDNPHVQVRREALIRLMEINDKKIFDIAVMSLNDEDFSIQIQAANVLKEMKDKRAVQPLLATAIRMKHETEKSKNCKLGHKRYKVTLACVQALAEIGDKQVGVILVKNKMYEFGYEVINELKKINSPEAIEVIVNIVNKEKNPAKYLAVKALMKLGDESAVEPLIKIALDEDNNIQYLAVEALGKIGDKRAVRPLMKLIGDKKSIVREKALGSLVNIGDKSIIDDLLKMLESDDQYFRVGAACILGEFKDKRAVLPLIKLLKDRKTIVRVRSIQALEKLADRRSFKPLMEALKEPEISHCAIIALGKLKDDRAVDKLYEIAQHGNRENRWIALNALVNVGSDKSIKALIKTFPYHSSYGSYRWILSGLSKNKKARKHMEKALKSPNPGIREQAKKVLDYMDMPSPKNRERYITI